MTFLLYLLCRLLHLILIYLSLPFVIVVVNIRSLERWRHKLKDRLREKKLRYLPELIFFCIVMVLVLPLYLLHLILWLPYRLLVKAEQKVKRCCDILQEKYLLKQGRFEIPQKDYIPAGAYRGSERPEAWIQKGVRKIDAEAFMGCKNLKKVGLPPSLRSIGAAAFKDCTALEKIVIPEGVTEIGREAFMDCFSLKQVVLPSTLTEISTEAFRGCTALEEIVIPEGVTRIGEEAFRNCRSLRSVFFPLSLKQIDSFAFLGCTALSSPIVIPSANKVDRYAFYDCPARHFYLPQIYSIGTTALPFHATLTAPPASQRYDISHRWFQYSRVSWYIKGLTGEVTILFDAQPKIRARYAKGSSVQSLIIEPGNEVIGREAFMHCRRLTDVSLPDTLVRIEQRAFADCSNLKKIRIPSSVTEIAGDAFPEHTRIFADPGSYAHHWAEKRGRL